MAEKEIFGLGFGVINIRYGLSLVLRSCSAVPIFGRAHLPLISALNTGYTLSYNALLCVNQDLRLSLCKLIRALPGGYLVPIVAVLWIALCFVSGCCLSSKDANFA